MATASFVSDYVSWMQYDDWKYLGVGKRWGRICRKLARPLNDRQKKSDAFISGFNRCTSHGS